MTRPNVRSCTELRPHGWSLWAFLLIQGHGLRFRVSGGSIFLIWLRGRGCWDADLGLVFKPVNPESCVHKIVGAGWAVEAQGLQSSLSRRMQKSLHDPAYLLPWELW